MTIRAAIVGPTGYTGLHLIRLLVGHPGARVTYLASHRDTLPDIREEFPQLLGRLGDQAARCRPIDADAIAADADVAFLALPHRAAMTYAPLLLDAGLRVIDLSADYRLGDPDLYARVYEHPHVDQENLPQAVYGLPELFRDDLPGAMLVANPGCYPTAAALGICPLLQRSLIRTDRIVVNAASGVTGAGRTPTGPLQFVERTGAFAAYGEIGHHRHQPEIDQTLSAVAGRPVKVLFVPHLLPIDQGILETIYLEPAQDDITQEDLEEAFDDAYSGEPFVRVRQGLPDTKYVRDTNFCDLAVRFVEHPSPTIVVFSALDNMIKGASGQAVQNMNLVFEQEETAGLL